MVGGYLIYVSIQKLQFQKINFLQNLNTLNLELLILENNNLKLMKMEVIKVEITKLTELNIIEDIQDGMDYFKFVCSSKMKVNDEEILFEFTEEEGSGGKLRLPNDNYTLEEVETVNNFNLCVILNIFQTGLWKHYQEMNIGDNWELAFDKKTWDEGGENRDWGYLTEPY